MLTALERSRRVRIFFVTVSSVVLIALLALWGLRTAAAPSIESGAVMLEVEGDLVQAGYEVRDEATGRRDGNLDRTWVELQVLRTGDSSLMPAMTVRLGGERGSTCSTPAGETWHATHDFDTGYSTIRLTCDSGVFMSELEDYDSVTLVH
ncbi:hypothetical protein [Microbacterium sp. SLBN-146]|uniref:hypothetical protein n=1 Tax=Microbacterium sp. SLBN-146 TaxID=2768457 RepID=UPI00114F8181|nr:hypothetical protein [Microbacterium sp. SLBN-146]TQJ30054.1 hypothetical protein FBY39_0499 [Microbacterium sp. SLBN-146]